jgi:hypothetical protein
VQLHVRTPFVIVVVILVNPYSLMQKLVQPLAVTVVEQAAAAVDALRANRAQERTKDFMTTTLDVGTLQMKQ